jgi:hypothetical protein
MRQRRVCDGEHRHTEFGHGTGGRCHCSGYFNLHHLLIIDKPWHTCYWASRRCLSTATLCFRQWKSRLDLDPQPCLGLVPAGKPFDVVGAMVFGLG